MKENNLPCINCVGICTNGAPSVVGLTKGFASQVKKANEKIIFIQCSLRGKKLVVKTIGIELKEIMDQVVQMVNYIKCKSI